MSIRTVVIGTRLAGTSVLFSILDIMASVGRDWEMLHGQPPVQPTFDVTLRTPDGAPYWDINGRKITPDAALGEAPEPDLIAMLPAGKLAKTNRFTKHHALDQPRPPLSRRRSPNLPNDHSWHDRIGDTPNIETSPNMSILYANQESDPQQPSQSAAPKMCICPSSPQGGGKVPVLQRH